MKQAINKIKCWQSLECNEYICTYSSGQTIVLYHRKVAWNNFAVHLMYDTALFKPRLEQARALQSEAVSGGRLILFWAWPCSCDTEQSCNARVHQVHPAVTSAWQQKCHRWEGSPQVSFPKQFISHRLHTTPPCSKLSTECSLKWVFEFLSAWCIINPIHVRQVWHWAMYLHISVGLSHTFC